ncbi:MAG: HAD family hydrolase [Rhodospirillaceae bacterium]|nr:HAD family hydrolase [Rhodospirillaceae bacterium]
MWSGPRNISTAMMRSFANRPDTAVIDEPLYGVYLAATGVDHPGRAEILAAMPTDWRVVVTGLTGPIPDGRSVFYQKHMAHHLLAEIDRAWLGSLRHAFLIRRPAAMLASYWRTRGEVTLTDTGLPQQLRLFEEMAGTTGTTPPVVDAADVLRDPEGMLRRLCAALGLAFLPAMLAWPPGPRTTDGVWARHWYGAVEASQGFAPYRAEDADLPPALADLAEECEGYYRQLHAHRLHAQA